MKRIRTAVCLALLPAFSVSALQVSAAETTEMPAGWLLWHSYSDYSALDSRLFLRTPDGAVSEITGDFLHAMNGSFGTSPDVFTFMAIDKQADEWDIFLSENGSISNLTKSSGFRNEDPKLSPDGRSIVFKRGRWDTAADGFVYDLALIDLRTKAVTMLTNDSAEEAMPCFSDDGRYLYFAAYNGGIGSICRMDLSAQTREIVYAEPGVTAYYPICRGEALYFTTWYSAENRCDRILRYDGAQFMQMPFDSAEYDCSDACPVSDTGMIFSSTMYGKYDLYYYDADAGSTVRLDALCSAQNDLGASFFAVPAGDINADGVCSIADAVLLQRWLLAVPDTALPEWKAGDLNGDDRLNAADLTLMKRKLL